MVTTPPTLSTPFTYIFSELLTFENKINNIAPIKYIKNKKINLQRKFISSYFVGNKA